MSEVRPICDRSALLRNRTRVKPDAMFLHEEAKVEIEDRLLMVNRPFNRAAIVTGHRDFWEQTLPDSKIVEDGETIDLPVGQFDLVVHAMALHWANDPVGQLIQCRRALAPDGLLLAILPAGQTLAELRASLSQAETQVAGGLSPRVLPMGDVRDLGSLLQRAGFALPVADSVTLLVEYDGLVSLAHDLRHMGEGNALSDRLRKITSRKVFSTADEIYRQHFPGHQKAIRATFELVTLTGWAPSETQQQPLRPGSAKARLADVLGTNETPLKD